MNFFQQNVIGKVVIAMCFINLSLFTVWIAWMNGFSENFKNLSSKISFITENTTSNHLAASDGAWKCKMPNKDPWHADLLSYLNPLEVGPMEKCVPSIVEMTQFVPFPDKLGHILSIKDSFAGEHKCKYSCLTTINDYKFNKGEWVEFTAPVQPPCDIIEVECFKGKEEKAVYNNLYYQIYRSPMEAMQTTSTQKPTVLEKNISKEKSAQEEKTERKEKGFSVHIIVLDSVSRSRFLRSLPKTMYFLREKLGAISYHHLNKVGLNSMPNAYAFLMGRQQEPLPKSPLHNVKVLPDKGFDWDTACSRSMNDEPSWIFSIFKKLGYKTMIAEDWAKGMFNWPYCTGFASQPTDHYMKPFQIRVEMDKNTFEKTHCREHYLFLLEYLQQFLEVYKDEQQKFTLTWITELTHNYLNTLYHADDTFYKWFKDTQDKMSDSFIFFMGDHGVRFGGHRSTPVGEMEDNNPGLFIVLPKRLRNNKKLREIMEENAKQLVSHHDTYATFLTIARSSHKWDESNWDSEWNASEYPEALHGSSLFHTLTKQPRDCPTLSIPFAYCQCDKKYVEIKPSPENDEIINQLAAASVGKLNQDIRNAKYNDKCAILSLDDAKDRIFKLEKLEIEGHQTEAKEKDGLIAGTFVISFQTKPGGGQFSGFLRADYKEEKIMVRNKRETKSVKRVYAIEFISDLFERLNSHGDQSQCAKNEPLIRPYCFCNAQPEKKS